MIYDQAIGPQPEQPRDPNLDALIQEIGRGNVVPIVGTDLVRLKADKDYRLMDYVLEKLEGQYDVEKFSYHDNNCDNAFEKINHIHSVVTKDRLGFYTYIRDIMEVAEPLCDTTSFDLLARISKFKLFINATFTNIMQESAKNNRTIISNKLDVFSLDITKSPPEDIYIESAINSISPAGSPQKLKKTVVYNLYGKWEWDSFIVVDDDILELVHFLGFNRDKLKTLYELLSSSSLLFIGCSFPDWLLRFFIRLFSRDRLSMSNSLYSVADIINSKVDRNRAIFIKNSSIKYFEFDGDAFVQRLYDRIKVSRPKWIRHNGEGDYIFLSYATENQSRVVDIYESLDENDFDVFMDMKKIDYGQDITQEVKTAIDNCKFFMPVISTETDSMAGGYRFFRKEWDYALELHKNKNPKNDITKKPVLLPVFLNLVKYNELKDTTPRQFFQFKYQGATAENGLSRAFIEYLRKQFNKK